MELFKWDESLSLGIRELDDQHKKFISYVNKLNNIIARGKTDNLLAPLFYELFEYSQIHFRLEEKLMSDHNYPLLEEHKKEHQDLSKELDKLYDKYNHKVINVTSEMMVFLKNWLINHITDSDMKFKPYLKGNIDQKIDKILNQKSEILINSPKAQYFEYAGTETKKQFLNLFRYPFLVEYSENSDFNNDKSIKFLTISETNIEKLIMNEFEARDQNKIKSIFPVLKTKKNPFSNKITVGRATSQDICIENPSISKFHAFFETEDQIEFTLTDHGSTNGTFVNGTKLITNIPKVIKDKDIISFSIIPFIFYFPETAYDIFKTADKF